MTVPPSSGPRYPVPLQFWAELAASVILQKNRSFRADAVRLIRGIHPPLRVLGEEHIPVAGRCVVTVNHYWSPTFWAPWMPLAMSAVVPVDMYWTMTGALTFPGWRGRRALRKISEIGLRGIAHAYQFNTMPPMPPDTSEAAERAASIHRLIQFARSRPEVVIGLAPEGGDQPGGILSLPPQGAGKLGLALARMGRVTHPVGIFEQEGQLTLRFGPPYMLSTPTTGSSTEGDLLARRAMTQAIARCLPERLRGAFGQPDED